jgi:hypothetical protein
MIDKRPIAKEICSYCNEREVVLRFDSDRLYFGYCDQPSCGEAAWHDCEAELEAEEWEREE